MFLNRTSDSRNNICGTKIAEIRKGMKISQRQLADLLSEEGLIVDKNAIQRIESGQRFVTDIELEYISKTLKVSFNELLGIK